MSAFHFLRPLWFLALPALLGLLWLLRHRRLRSRSWQEICDPALLPHLLLGRSHRRANWPLWLMPAGVLLGVTALAGPTWRQLPQPLLRQQSALVICLDLSRSMLAADLKPSRLVRARLKIQDILRQRLEGQTALVAFSGDAFAITPLTDDHRTIEALLGTLEPDLMPVQGSAPQRALALGAELLQQAGLKKGTLLLVTDEDRPALAEAAVRELAFRGITLQVLGVGTPEGAPIPMPEGGFFKDGAGNLVLPPLDEPGLKQLAEAGGGAYRRLSVDDGDFQALLADLESRRLDRAESAQNRLGDRWEEAGVFLLLPLTLLAACGFRRGWLVVFALLFLVPPQASALSRQDLWASPDRQASGAFNAGQYEAAAGRFEDPRWKSSALYKAGRYDEALKALPESQSADDWYNRGNALARTGQFPEALRAYDQALKLKPGDADALANRKVVEEALEKQQQEQPPQDDQKDDSGDKPKEGENKQDKGDSQKQGKDSSSPSDQSGQGDQDKPPKDSSSGESKPAPGQKDQPKPPAEQKQAQSQEAQAAKKEPAENENPAAAAPETAPQSAEEREMQQWLQSLPDDPGGLLRRKFLYQYRRRGQQQLESDRPW